MKFNVYAVCNWCDTDSWFKLLADMYRVFAGTAPLSCWNIGREIQRLAEIPAKYWLTSSMYWLRKYKDFACILESIDDFSSYKFCAVKTENSSHEIFYCIWPIGLPECSYSLASHIISLIIVVQSSNDNFYCLDPKGTVIC